jgi:Fic family protein
LLECLNALELYLHQDDELPILIKAALVHVQFETIHPFLDGNGRLGRLLITLLLCNAGVLKQPLLYLSLYFKTRRDEYYHLLQKVRVKGDWAAWLTFFLQGVHETAEQAVTAANQCQALFKEDANKIRALGRISGSCLQLHQLMQKSPIVRIGEAAKELGINRTTITNCINHMLELEIISEVTGYRKNRLFRYDAYVSILAEGTEPL